MSKEEECVVAKERLNIPELYYRIKYGLIISIVKA